MVSLVLLALLLLPVALIGGGLALFMKRRRRSILRWSAISYLILVVVFFLALGPYLVAYALIHAGTRPMDLRLKETPADFRVPYEDVVFQARDTVRLSGWFIPPRGAKVILVCTHGLFRNRVELLSRIMPLTQRGYGALLYDSRSHGASEKAKVSLGYYERYDVLGAIGYVRRRYQDALEQPRIVLLGVSMGAVAVLEAADETKDYSAVILDSPFTNLRETAVRHSWLFFKMPRYPFPSLFMFWFERLSGFNPDRVDAVNAIRHMEPVPTLIIASEGDIRMGPGPARQLFEACRAPDKKLKIFGKDVPHGAAAREHPEAYDKLLKEFLDEALVMEPGDVAGPQGSTSPSASEDPRK
jgi:pimeloyl-ACP methyl ester carboxylesterase